MLASLGVGAETIFNLLGWGRSLQSDTWVLALDMSDIINRCKDTGAEGLEAVRTQIRLNQRRPHRGTPGDKGPPREDTLGEPAQKDDGERTYYACEVPVAYDDDDDGDGDDDAPEFRVPGNSVTFAQAAETVRDVHTGALPERVTAIAAFALLDLLLRMKPHLRMYSQNSVDSVVCTVRTVRFGQWSGQWFGGPEVEICKGNSVENLRDVLVMMRDHFKPQCWVRIEFIHRSGEMSEANRRPLEDEQWQSFMHNFQSEFNDSVESGNRSPGVLYERRGRDVVVIRTCGPSMTQTLEILAFWWDQTTTFDLPGHLLAPNGIPYHY